MPSLVRSSLEGASQHIVESDQELFRSLMDGFTVLAQACARFSQEVYRRTGTAPDVDLDGTIERNLKIARTVFERWCLDILAVVYLNKSIGVAGLKKSLGGIGDRLLQAKLGKLEEMGLIQRENISRRGPEKRFSLTHKGEMIARLGEPVFLYLRLADGWRSMAPPEGAREDHESDRLPAEAEHA